MGASSCVLESSPFEIPHDQLHHLRGYDEFQVLRTCLAHQDSFCQHHASADREAQEAWLLHRDILHALTMPILRLYDRASVLAKAALCTLRQEDLELAFAGESRGAFLCLQCFICEERDWFETKGCPACVAMETLSTESHIRLVIAAILVSATDVASKVSLPATRVIANNAQGGPPRRRLQPDSTLPPLPHILPALKSAIDKDAFWGGYWLEFYERATQLCTGIQALIASCDDLESLVSSPVRSKSTAKRSATMPGLLYPNAVMEEEKGARLMKSKLAARQLRMKGEEMELMRHCALQHWSKFGVTGKMKHELLGRVEKRRCSTGP